MGQLSATGIKAIKEPGRYIDGDGLMLLVKPTGAKAWVLRLTTAGKRRDIGLGFLKVVSIDTVMRMQNSFDIAQARQRATEFEVVPYEPSTDCLGLMSTPQQFG